MLPFDLIFNTTLSRSSRLTYISPLYKRGQVYNELRPMLAHMRDHGLVVRDKHIFTAHMTVLYKHYKHRPILLEYDGNLCEDKNYWNPIDGVVLIFNSSSRGKSNIHINGKYIYVCHRAVNSS